MFKTVALLLVKNGLVVQSTEFMNFIPLGRLDIALESLVVLNPDEICIIDVDGNIEKTLEIHSYSLNSVNLPMCVGGGASAELINRFAVERLLQNSAIFNNLNSDQDMLIGKQALIAYLPYKLTGDRFLVFNSDSRKFVEKKIEFLQKILSVYSEIVLLDADGQGIKNGFNDRIFDYIPSSIINRIYLCGGMNSLQVQKAKSTGYSGVIIDNTSLYEVSRIDRRYFDAM